MWWIVQATRVLAFVGCITAVLVWAPIAIRAFTKRAQEEDALGVLIAGIMLNIAWFIGAWWSPPSVQDPLRACAYFFTTMLAVGFVRVKRRA